ncbi:MAG: peptidoglycan-binding protein [Acutalibacteraceae bacterium]|nr:peptidoglycan-binding protein [Acutalibacteraceae bacterium]
MFKKFIALSLAVAMLTGASGCDFTAVSDQISDKISINNKATAYPVIAGREKILKQPQRILVLDDNVADILLTCGYADKIVGCSTDCTQKELANVQKYGSDINPRTDITAKANADIIFASPDISYEDYKALKKSNALVLRMAPATSIDNLDILFTNICKIMSGNIEGEQKGKAYADAVINLLEHNKSEKIVKGCYIYSVDKALSVTLDMYENDILRYAGVQNIASEMDTRGKLPFTKITAADKQQGFAFYIFCEKGMKQEILQSDTFKNSNTVNKNRVIEIPSEYLTRQGKDSAAGVAYITKAIHDNNNRKGESVAESYGIEIFDGISYTLDEEDSNVFAIQQRLKDLGYATIAPTGYFGQSTADAVKSFQINNELNRRDGVADKDTIEKLFSTAAFSNINPGITPSQNTANTTPEATEAPTELATFTTVE